MKTKSFNLIIIFLLLFGLPCVKLQAQLNSLDEDFNEGFPQGWDVSEGVTQSSYQWRSSSTGYEGKGMMFNSNGSAVGNTSALKTPLLKFTSDKVLTFWFKNPKGGDFSVFVDVFESDNVTYKRDTLAKNLVADDWTLKSLSISDYTNQTIKIVFRSISNKYGSAVGNHYLDNVITEDISICAYPIDIELYSVSQTEATLMWALAEDAGSEPDTFRITVVDALGNFVGKYNDFPFVNDGSYIYTIEGLDNSSKYTVKMQSDCDRQGKGLSKMAKDFTFTTLCKPIGVPYYEGFNAENRLLSNCWIINPETFSSVEISTSTYKYGDSGYSLLLNGNSKKATYVVSNQFAHAGNDLEVSFMVYSSIDLPFNVGLTSDPLSAENFDILWSDTTIVGEGWREVRFCTDASYYEDAENLSLFISLKEGVSGTLYIDDVNVKIRPICPRIEKLRVSNILAKQVTLNWIEFGNAGSYEVEITDEQNISKIQKVNTHPIVISDLVGNSEYTIRVRSVCSSEKLGEWSLPITFNTACDVMPTTEFIESFESSQKLIPECWEVKQFVAGYGEGDNYGNKGIDVYTPSYTQFPPVGVITEAKDGENVLRFRKSKGGTRTAIITQAIQIENPNSYDMSFWMYRNGAEITTAAGVVSESLRVLVNDTPDTIGAIELGVINSFYQHIPKVNAPGYYLYDYNIPLSGKVYIIIEATAQTGGYDLYIDDLRVYPAPSCRKVRDIEMLSPTKTSFSMKWTPGESETSWIVRYRLTDQETGATIDHSEKMVTGSPEFELNTLSHSTAYRIAGRVAAFCGVGDTADWIDFDYKFQTECDVMSLPFREGFNANIFPPVCWNVVGGVNIGGVNQHERTDFLVEGSNGVMFTNPGNGQAFVTPQFNFVNGTQYRVSLMVYRNKGNGGIKVMLNDKPDTIGATELMFIPISTQENPLVENSGYYKYKIDFEGNGLQHILFVHTSTDNKDAYIDEVVVSVKPDCEPIIDFEVENISSNSAVVKILDEGVASCEASVCVSGTLPDNGMIFTSDSAIINISGLQAETVYEVYTRTVCGDKKGDWTFYKKVFVTHCSPFEVTKTTPFIEDFENFNDGDILLGCYLSDGYFSTTGIDLFSKPPLKSNEGELSAWINGRLSWLYRPVKLKKGINYEMSAYAIQAGTSSHISFAYGSLPIEDSMIFVMQEEKIADKWNKHVAYFQVPEDGIYYFGIKVYASTSIGIDNITIQEINCVPAVSVVSEITSTSATIDIVDESAGKWIVSVNDFEFTPEQTRGNVLYDTITTLSVLLDKLQSDRYYYYAIKSICGDGEESSWGKVQRFKTRCSAVVVPFTESFEDDLNCWSFWGENYFAKTNSANSITGNNSLFAGKATVVSPELDVETLTDYMVTGWIRSDVADQNISIGVMTNPNDVSTFEPMGYFHIQENLKWYQFKVYFSDLSLDDYADFKDSRYVVINLPQDEVSFYIDDIKVSLAPKCKQPLEAEFIDVTENSCTIGWASKGEESSWNIIGKISERVVIDTIVTSNPAIITGLNHSTTYQFEIQTMCSDEEFSEMTLIGNVTTDCGSQSLPYVEDFSGYASGTLPLCWENQEGSSWYIEQNNRIFFPDNGFNKVDYKGTVLSPTFDLRNELGALLHINLMNKDAGNVTIKLSIDGGNTYPIVLGSGYIGLTEYKKLTFDLTSYVGKEVRVAIEGTATGIEGSYILVNYFEIEKIESCMRPVDLTLQSISETQVTVVINDTTSATAWQYMVVRSNEFKGNKDVESEIVDVKTKTFTINNLSGFTNYDLYVRSNCGAEEQSSWRNISFKTACAEINSIPYFESFENIESETDGCFSIFRNDTITSFYPDADINQTWYSEGEQSLSLSTSAVSPIFVVMPQFDVPTTSLKVTFDYLSKRSSYISPDVVVGVLTDPDDYSTFEEVATFVPFVEKKDIDGNEIFETVSVSFNVLDLEFANSYIAFSVGPKSDGGRAFIDNIRIEKVNGCPEVRSIDLIDVIDNKSARIVLDYRSAAVQVAYGLATQSIDSLTRIISNLDTIELTGLNKATNYAVYARSICGNDTGNWIRPLLFSTDCDVYAIDDEMIYTETFNSLGEHPLAFPVCFTRINSVIENNIEYPKISIANEYEGDKQVLHLYKDAAVALPEFNLSGEKLMIEFSYHNNLDGTRFQVGLQEDLSSPDTYQIVHELYASQKTRDTIVDLSQYDAVGKYIVFKGNVNTTSVYIDNIVVSKAPECFAPTDLAVETIGDTFATITWNYAPAAIRYECELSSENGVRTFNVDTLTEKLLLNDLSKKTKYDLSMRAICDLATDWKKVSFTTLNSVPVLPYNCGFEENDENREWVLANGNQRNKFKIGSNSNNSVYAGDSALYIVDAVGDYLYNSSGSDIVYAYRTFLFEPGDYRVSFNWKAKGDEYDYGRVLLVPTKTYISPAEQLGNVESILLHEQPKLYGSAQWKQEAAIFTIENPTNYHFVVEWQNEYSGGENPPLSIDNISISKIKCGIIREIELLSVSLTEAEVVFEKPLKEGSVDYRLSLSANVDEAFKSGSVIGDTISLSGLTADTQYYLYVRPVCDGDDDVSPWSMFEFSTECYPISVSETLSYIEDFEGYLDNDLFDNCWAEDHLLGKNSWIVNDVRESAYSGDKFVSLSGQNKNYVTRSFQLEGNKYYKISVYAKQNKTSSGYINIIALDSMGIKVLTRQEVTNIGYQNISAEFFATETGIYQLGLMGEISGSDYVLMVDDFKVESFIAGAPFDLKVGIVNNNSVELFWKGNASKYEVRILQSGVKIVEQIVEDDSVVISGLQPSMSYEAQVRSLYGEEISTWSRVKFVTDCGVIYPPYVENFENTNLTLIPLCWDNMLETNLVENIYNWGVFQPDESLGNECGYCVRIQCASTDGYATLFTPQINIDGDYSLSFRYSINSGTEKLKILVKSSTGTDTLGILGFTDNSWKIERFDLAKYKNDIVQIGFYATAKKSSSEYIVLDDVKVMCFADDVVIEDSMCQPSQGVVTYDKYGFSVSSSVLQVGLNIIEKLFEAQSKDECDTLKTLHLTMNPSGIYQFNDTICEGEVYNKGVFNGRNYSIGGFYDERLTSSCGCDSVIRLNLTVLNINHALVDTICEGDVYEFGNKKLTEAGIYVDTTINSRGCDSITTLTLVVTPKYFITNKMVCEGVSVQWGDTILMTSGRYEKVHYNSLGCDSVEVFELVVLPSEVEVYDTICSGSYYQFVDTVLYDAGLYVRTFQNVLRCDSTVRLNLHVVEPKPTIVDDYVCEGEFYSGYGYSRITITQDTLLVQRISSPGKCDSLVHVYVDFVEIVEVDITASIEEGDFYDFGENSLTKSGKYREVFVSSQGCDSIVNLTLNVETAVDNVYALPLVIAPNPISIGEITFINRTWTMEEQRGLRIEVVDAIGQVINVDYPTVYPISIGVLNTRGIYFVRVLTGTGDVYIGKVMVK